MQVFRYQQLIFFFKMDSHVHAKPNAFGGQLWLAAIICGLGFKRMAGVIPKFVVVFGVVFVSVCTDTLRAVDIQGQNLNVKLT